MDAETILARLALRRPVFHSERDFQLELAREIQLADRAAEVRLETRPSRGVHLDILVRSGAERTAVELKYLLAGFDGAVGDESFDLPNRSAHDISRYDTVKDVARIEKMISIGAADTGSVIALTNDSSYWRPPTRSGSIDEAFRIHEGQVLTGTIGWAPHAGAGTTRGREAPQVLRGRYECHWTHYASVGDRRGRQVEFRYLLIRTDGPSSTSVEAAAEADSPSTRLRTAIVEPATSGIPDVEPSGARDAVLAAARALAAASGDGTFHVDDVVAEVRRQGSSYADSTIRTHVISRMCVSAPDHHASVFRDIERVGPGRYRLL